jgi:hypothetical protein
MTASKLKIYVDKTKKYIPVSKEEIVKGTKFLHGGLTYEIIWVKGVDVWMEATSGMRQRSTIVSVEDLTKSGTSYIIQRDGDT